MSLSLSLSVEAACTPLVSRDINANLFNLNEQIYCSIRQFAAAADSYSLGNRNGIHPNHVFSTPFASLITLAFRPKVQPNCYKPTHRPN